MERDAGHEGPVRRQSASRALVLDSALTAVCAPLAPPLVGPQVPVRREERVPGVGTSGPEKSNIAQRYHPATEPRPEGPATVEERCAGDGPRVAPSPPAPDRLLGAVYGGSGRT